MAATLEAALLESWQSAGTLAHVWGQRPTCVLTRAHARRSPRSHGEHAALPRDDGCALEVACARAILRSEPRDIRIDRATGAVHAHLQRRRSRRPRWRVCARRCTRREVGESAVRPQLMVLQRIKAVRAAATLRARPRRSVPPAYGPSCVRARDMGRQATIRALGGDLGAYVAQWSCANAGTRRSAGRRGRSAASAPLAHQQHAAPHVDLWDVSRSRLALCPRSSRTTAP